MRILITGGSGVLGRALQQVLQGRGHEVIACGRHAAAEFCRWDVAREERPHPPVQVDAVIHAAARIGGFRGSLAELPELMETNSSGTARVVQWCAATGVKYLLYVSSAIVYGEWPRPRKELDLVAPAQAGPYAVSKWCGEEAVRLLPAGTTGVVRLATLYGAEYRTGLIRRLFAQAEATGRITLQQPVNDLLSLVHVADAARTIAQAVEMRAVGLWNVGSTQPVTLRELGEYVARLTHVSLHVEEAASRSPRSLNLVDDTKARQELGHCNGVTMTTALAAYRGTTQNRAIKEMATT